MTSNATPDDAGDPSLKWSEIREISLRMEDQRKYATDSPSTRDDEWRWFLTLFRDKSNQDVDSVNRPAA